MPRNRLRRGGCDALANQLRQPSHRRADSIPFGADTAASSARGERRRETDKLAEYGTGSEDSAKREAREVAG